MIYVIGIDRQPRKVRIVAQNANRITYNKDKAQIFCSSPLYGFAVLLVGRRGGCVGSLINEGILKKVVDQGGSYIDIRLGPENNSGSCDDLEGI
jgi:hypothetical protein